VNTSRRWRIDLEPEMQSLADQAAKLPPDRRDALVEYIEQERRKRTQQGQEGT